MRENFAGHVRGQVDTLRPATASTRRIEVLDQRASARSPHRYRRCERLHVVASGNANLPAGQLALYPPAVDDARPLCVRLAHPNVAADSPTEQQPVDLVSELLGRRG